MSRRVRSERRGATIEGSRGLQPTVSEEKGRRRGATLERPVGVAVQASLLDAPKAERKIDERELMDAARKAWRSATMEFATPELTRVLTAAFEAHQPPMSQGRTAKMRYAHGGGKLPPRIVIHGSRTNKIPPSYTRYLSSRLIEHYKLQGTTLVIEYRDSDNPYRGRKNVLTPRQLAKRKRLKKHVGRK